MRSAVSCSELERVPMNEASNPGSRQKAGPAGPTDRGARGLLMRLWRRLVEEVIGEVPRGDELCEFDCAKTQCRMGEWATCKRRLAQASRDLQPETDEEG